MWNASRRQTLCAVSTKDQAIRLINAIPDPCVIRANNAREEMIAASADLITALHRRACLRAGQIQGHRL